MSELAQFMSDAFGDTVWTPDVPLLESQEDWYVFVYGSRRGKASSYFTGIDSDAEFTGISWTKSDVYSILNVEDGTYNYTLADVLGTNRILGEVWKVPTEMLMELDGEEQNQLVTKRIPIPVRVGGIQDISAWIYIADRKYLTNSNLLISKMTSCTYIGTDRYLEIH